MRAFGRLFVLLAALGALAGCSTQATAPLILVPDAYRDPTFLAVPPSASARIGESGHGAPLTGSKVIDGDNGGYLRVGRFRIDIPAGAFAGSATFTIDVPDRDRLVATVSAPGVDAFAAPVLLTVDCLDAKGEELDRVGVLGQVDARDVWLLLPNSSVDVPGELAQADLKRPSTFGVASLVQGKAGW